MSAGPWAAGALAMVAASSVVASARFRTRPEVAAIGAGARPGTIARRARNALARAGSVWPVRRGWPDDLSEHLDAAGWSVGPAEVMGASIVTAAIAGACCLSAPSPIRVLAPLVAFLGSRAPLLIVRRAAARRRGLAYRELPSLLDMLSAAAGAGVPGPLALRRAAAVTDGPLGRELRRAFDRADLGARWREQVDAVARRLDLVDLRRVTAALGRTETLGSALADPVRTLADDVREERRAAAADRARRAPVKMLFPLVFLILPAFLLLTVVPVLVATLGSIR